MPNDRLFPIQVTYTAEFKSNLKRLAKRYRHIKSDVDPLITQLAEGEQPGDRVPGTNYVVYKVRLANSDNKKGKSAGYRVIYCVEDIQHVVLVTIYSKSDQPDIKAHQINAIIQNDR